MSKTNNEPMQPENQAGGGLKLDVNVRPIAPMGNLLGRCVYWQPGGTQNASVREFTSL